MASSTVAIAAGGWISLGSAAALIESKSTCGVWIIDAASQPAAAVLTGDFYLAGGASQLFQPAATLWALPGQGAAAASIGVNPQNIPGGGGGGSGSNASVGSTGAVVPASATAVGFQNASGNLVLPTPSAGLPVADSGSAITGASIPAGGAGLTGWLSAIWSSGATAANQLTANTTLSSILTELGAVVLSAGSAIIGKVGIDQTTPGTTNGVVINSSATIPTTETYVNLATAQVSVGASGGTGTNGATLIVAARTGRKETTIVNHGTTALYLGPSAVTAATGQLLAGVAGEGITYSGGAALYGITASGSQTVSVAEVY